MQHKLSNAIDELADLPLRPFLPTSACNTIVNKTRLATCNKLIIPIGYIITLLHVASRVLFTLTK